MKEPSTLDVLPNASPYKSTPIGLYSAIQTNHKAIALFIPSVLGRIFIFILLIFCRFSTALETHVGIEIVQTLAINLLTSIDSC